MKHGQRWGDPWGGAADHDAALLTGLSIERTDRLGPGTFMATWTWTGCRLTWGRRWGNPRGVRAVWFKVYVNGQLRATVSDTRYSFSAEPGNQLTVGVVVVGPSNGDSGYSPSIALETVPGNRVKLTWTPPSDIDVERYNIYWDSGGGTVSYASVKAAVREDGSTSYEWTSEELADGTYKFVVRAQDIAGNVETNTTEVSVTIAAWPAAPTALAYSYDEATDKVTLTWSGGATVNVYSNSGSGNIDYSSAEASGQTSPWLSAALTGAAVFKYVVRADNGTYEEKNTENIEFEIDAAEDEVTVPNSPFGLTVEPTAAGEFIVSGRYDAREESVAAGGGVRIYHDNATGTMDWATQIGTASLTLESDGRYRFTFTTSESYSDGAEIKFGARGVTSGGVTDSNTDTATGTADASAPGAPSALAGSAVRDTRGSAA